MSVKLITENVKKPNMQNVINFVGWNICVHCDAKFWMDEKGQNSSRTFPSFTVCCAGDKASLPPLLRPPPYLMDLYTSLKSDAEIITRSHTGKHVFIPHYINSIRKYITLYFKSAIHIAFSMTINKSQG
ncbi:hypothetical protein RhiirC2_793165 [Rhizophagus irregularis]|uniref:Uncharacterized protein n=1 Tax=Rhizophagus irregularis TaxID=588596 RepID=A0A2N1MFZ2_9GLOM|nr:hypothetical protein RhiirC2_793165 [Rhizophagus irregularis]